MAKYPPSYQYYPNDFDGSTSGWSLPEVGMYQRLLNHQWVNGHVPNDQDEIMRICRATQDEVKRYWPKVSGKFDEPEPGVLRNSRLEEIREKALRFSRAQAAKGRKGGKAERKKSGVSRGQAGAKPRGKPGGSREEAFQSSVFKDTTVVEASASTTKEGNKNADTPSPPGQGSNGEPKRGRARDLVWEAIMEVCGIEEPITKSARGGYNSACSELKEGGATPSEIKRRASIYRRKFSGAALTPTALAKHWAQLAKDDAPGESRYERIEFP